LSAAVTQNAVGTNMVNKTHLIIVALVVLDVPVYMLLRVDAIGTVEVLKIFETIFPEFLWVGLHCVWCSVEIGVGTIAQNTVVLLVEASVENRQRHVAHDGVVLHKDHTLRCKRSNSQLWSSEENEANNAKIISEITSVAYFVWSLSGNNIRTNRNVVGGHIHNIAVLGDDHMSPG